MDRKIDQVDNQTLTNYCLVHYKLHGKSIYDFGWIVTLKHTFSGISSPLSHCSQKQYIYNHLTSSNLWHPLEPTTKWKDIHIHIKYDFLFSISLCVLLENVKKNVYYKGRIAQIERLLFRFGIVEEDIPIFVFMQILCVCRHDTQWIHWGVFLTRKGFLYCPLSRIASCDTWYPVQIVGPPPNCVIEVVFEGVRPLNHTGFWNSVRGMRPKQ